MYTENKLKERQCMPHASGTLLWASSTAGSQLAAKIHHIVDTPSEILSQKRRYSSTCSNYRDYCLPLSTMCFVSRV